MCVIVCLVTNPQARTFDHALIRELERALHGRTCWLSDDEAVEIATDRFELDEARQRVAPLLAPLMLDWAVLPDEDRRKRLLVSDMDSTMITVECIDELADFVGLKPQIAEVTRRAMNGELAFVPALLARVALLEGLRESVIVEVIRERVRMMPGARTLVQTMRAHGSYTALVSGGFTAFTRHVRDALGIDMDEANELEVKDNRLTGKLLNPIRDAASKLAALQRLRDERALPRTATLAAGDGANDLPMLKAAGLGIGYHAHPRVRAEAPVNIVHADLTAMLYLQGYRRAEFMLG